MTENKDTEINSQLEYKLKNDVESWVKRTFNFIHVTVLEELCSFNDQALVEKIQHPPYQEILTQLMNEINQPDLDEMLSYVEDFFDESNALDIKENGFENTEEEYCCSFYNFLLKKNFNTTTLEELLYDSGNYPMWNTTFEIRGNNPWKKICEEAPKVGLGVIRNIHDCLNDVLFMKSAGHDFYESYWIPLYLRLYSREREKYKFLKDKYPEAFKE